MALRLSIKRVSIFASFGVLAVIFLVSVQGHAQVAGASLTGTVTDPSGSVIPNAQVSITNTATGITSNVTTNSAGFYATSNLIPGPYQVTIRADGFQTQIRSGITLTVGEQQVLNGALPLGQTSQTIEVSGEAATVELSSSTMSETVAETTVRELPLNGRDWTSLANLEPGVVPVRSQNSVTKANGPRGSRGFGNALSDDGHQPNQNNYRINGISVNDYANGGPGNVLGGSLGVDAIQEFSVLTSNYSAEYGRTSGGVVNAITKSGTNSFHGDAYWFLRDQKLDARNFFDPAVIPPFHRNNFGVAAGSPIIKDKTFVFFDYEGIRQDKSLTFSDSVPSPAARAGNLCSIPTGVTPNCTSTTITVSPSITPFLPLYPLPNGRLIGDGDTGVYSVSGLQQFSENYETLRVDHKISGKDSLAASWFRDFGPFSQPDPLVDSLGANQVLRQMFSVEETHVFSPTFVNTARFGYNRANAHTNEPVKAFNPSADDPALGSLPGRFASILNVPGLTQMGGGFGAPAQSILVFNSFQGYDDAFLTRGTHTIKFGVAVERMQDNDNSLGQANGLWAFPNLQGFLLDEPTELSVAAQGKEVSSRQSLFAGYVQDDWRARPNLTLNVGVRYEPTTIPIEAHNNFLTIQNFYNGIAVPVTNLWRTNASLRNVAPRVGFSWDPFRNGKTAVRGGFGIFDILPLPYIYSSNSMTASLPFSDLVIITSGIPQGAFPTAGITPAIFNPTSPNPATATNRFVELNPHDSYSVNWNLNIQREITPSLTAMLGYVGSSSVHLSSSPDNMDMVLPTLTSAGYLWPFPVGSGTRFNPNVGTLRATVWDGHSSYSGLEARITKKMSHGFQAQASYTWSKCLDNGSGGPVGDTLLNSIASLLWFDQSSRRGLCDFNVGQNLVVNYIWDIPKPKFGGAAGSLVLGGWEAAGIVSASTGEPFTMFISGDPQGMKGDPWPYPDRVSGCNPYNANFKSQGMIYLNVSCFIPPVVPASFPNYATSCQPAAASVAAVIPNTCMNLQGNAGRNELIGPNVRDFDFSLIKNTRVPKISESFNVQFRAEFFNILNRANFQLPADNLYVLNTNGTPLSGASKIDATSVDSREIQFGLKVIW